MFLLLSFSFPDTPVTYTATFGNAMLIHIPHNSWTYLVRDGPRYPIGHSINLGAQVITLALATFGILYNLRENRVRAAGKRNHRLEGLTDQEKRDLGHHHPDFRYIP